MILIVLWKKHNFLFVRMERPLRKTFRQISDMKAHSQQLLRLVSSSKKDHINVTLFILIKRYCHEGPEANFQIACRDMFNF